MQTAKSLAFCTGACSCDVIDETKTVRNTAITASKRAAVCSPARWCNGVSCIWERSTTASKPRGGKTLEVFDEQQQRSTSLSLFTEDRPAPAEVLDSIQ